MSACCKSMKKNTHVALLTLRYQQSQHLMSEIHTHRERWHRVECPAQNRHWRQRERVLSGGHYCHKNLVKNNTIGSLFYCHVDSYSLRLQWSPSLLLYLVPQRLEIESRVSQWLWKCPFWPGMIAEWRRMTWFFWKMNHCSRRLIQQSLLL